MIGIQIGVQIGTQIGVQIGASGSGGSIAGVTRDATSGAYRPNSAAEWALLLAAAGDVAGGPSGAWPCQDASGNLADVIGANPLVPTGAGHAYSVAEAGWTSVTVTLTNGGANRFGLAAGTFDPSAHSVMWLGYMDVTPPAGVRGLICGSDSAAATELAGMVSGAANHPEVKDLAAGTAGTSVITAGMSPYVLQLNRTGTSVTFYTLQEKVVGTYGAGIVDGNKGFGAGVVTSAGIKLNYGTLFLDAAAERTSGQIKNLLTTLGGGLWTFPWS